MSKKTQSKEMKALRALKKLKNYRAMAYGGATINEVITYGSSGGGGGNYNTSYNNSSASYGGPTSGSSGTSYGGGSGGGGSSTSAPPVEEKEEEAVIDEILVEAEPIPEPEKTLISEVFRDENGDYNAPVYELSTSGAMTQEELDAEAEEFEKDNPEMTEEELEERKRKREEAEANKISPEDNAAIQEVVNTMATNQHPLHGSAYAPVDSPAPPSGTGTVNTNASGAPIDIEQTNPTYVAPEMEAAKIGVAAGYAPYTTQDRNIEKLDDAGTTYAGTVDAPASVGYSSQKAPTKVKAPEDMEGQTYTAAQAGDGTDVTAAQGKVSKDAQAKLDDATLTEKAEAAERDKAEEKKAEAEVEKFVISKGAYVNEVTGEVATVVQAKDAEAAQREAITGEPTPEGEAAEIMSMYEFNQLEKRAISKDNAIKNLKSQGLSDKAIAKRLADNPQLIADEFDDLPEDIKTTLSGLPQEALVSVQMETLMAGMEDGEIPAWARPALAKVESNLAIRGMSSSSIGRDALFNAIIQSAIPMAQSNAQAVQNATSQDKQIAADFLAKNAGFKQQMDMANMSNDQQMRLANLSALNQASSENMNARQQTELANLNNRMQTNLLQGKIAADMGIAQLNVDQQRAVQNASMVANVDMTKFNAAQQVELTNSKFMQSMVATKFSADQQTAMQNATAMATMDMANLDKNAKLAVQNAQAFLQMDMTNLSNEQQSNVLKAQNQQQVLLSDTAAKNAALQFGAANEQQVQQFMASLGVQVEQYNSSSNAAREQFNATAKDRAAAIDAGNELQAASLQAQLDTDVAKFNEQQDFQRDQWNASNAQAVEQSNVQWRRQANLVDTAAQNSANQQNAQIAYNLTSQEQTQLWQQMRDEAAYIRQNFENEQQRKAQMLATAIGNEKVFSSSNRDNVSLMLSTLNTAIS